MKKLFFIIIVSLLLTACAASKSNVAVCTKEAKLCPDGTAVGRIGPNCEFAACPGAGE